MTRVLLDDSRYPRRVKRVMGERAPTHLDMLGNLDILDMQAIGFSGSRKASAKGLEVARDYAKQVVGRGWSVVSGNASGIDSVAHFASLRAGGNTILVLPEGINHFREKKEFATVWDWKRVLIISQFQEDDTWQGWRAMTRNKLIISLSRAMIVFEAGAMGGTLDAGKQTLKAGLPLFVAESVPTAGNQKLLDEGARNLKNTAEIPLLYF